MCLNDSRAKVKVQETTPVDFQIQERLLQKGPIIDISFMMVLWEKYHPVNVSK